MKVRVPMSLTGIQPWASHFTTMELCVLRCKAERDPDDTLLTGCQNTRAPCFLMPHLSPPPTHAVDTAASSPSLPSSLSDLWSFGEAAVDQDHEL